MRLASCRQEACTRQHRRGRPSVRLDKPCRSRCGGLDRAQVARGPGPGSSEAVAMTCRTTEGECHARSADARSQRSDPAKRSQPLRDHCRRSAAVLSHAGHVPVELPSQGVLAHSRDGRGEVPVLQRRLRAEGLEAVGPGGGAARAAAAGEVTFKAGLGAAAKNIRHFLFRPGAGKKPVDSCRKGSIS